MEARTRLASRDDIVKIADTIDKIALVAPKISTTAWAQKTKECFLRLPGDTIDLDMSMQTHLGSVDLIHKLIDQSLRYVCL
jgi:hypothetical protein